MLILSNTFWLIQKKFLSTEKIEFLKTIKLLNIKLMTTTEIYFFTVLIYWMYIKNKSSQIIGIYYIVSGLCFFVFSQNIIQGNFDMLIFFGIVYLITGFFYLLNE